MMKHYWLLISLAALAACGGGGGGGSPSTDSTPIQNPSAQDAGKAGVQFYSTGNPAATIAFDADIKKIKVDGVSFDLANAGGASINKGWHGNFGGIRAGQAQVPANIANHLVYTGSENVAVGVITTTSGSNSAFYNGRFTDVAQMPVTGTATYSVGAATFISGGQVISGGNLLTADFGAKKLTGELKTSGSIGGKVVLDADISGNKFSSANGAATQVEGGFFGSRAEEVGGIFRHGNAVGAFAGGRQ